MMATFYEQSQVLIISLKSDSVWGYYIPSKFQAYLNCGKPILAVMDGAVKSYVERYELGESAMPGSVDAIKGAFLKLRNIDVIRLNKVKNSSQQLIQNEFCREVILAKIVDKLKRD